MKQWVCSSIEPTRINSEMSSSFLLLYILSYPFEYNTQSNTFTNSIVGSPYIYIARIIPTFQLFGNSFFSQHMFSPFLRCNYSFPGCPRQSRVPRLYLWLLSRVLKRPSFADFMQIYIYIQYNRTFTPPFICLFNIVPIFVWENCLEV